ncbi:hypothetical protein ACFVHQ_20205 [Actinomycetes bacterium NPDC127524]
MNVEFDLEIPDDFDLNTVPTFKEAVGSLKYQWVKINRGGKESLEGIHDDITEDYVTMLLHEEVFRIAMFHIRIISYGLKIEKKEKDESAKDENNKSDQKDK